MMSRILGAPLLFLLLSKSRVVTTRNVFSPNSSGAEWGSQFFQETGFVPSSFPGSG